MSISPSAPTFGWTAPIVPLKELPAIPLDVTAKFMWCGQAKGWVMNDIMQELINKVFIPEVEGHHQRLGLPVDSPALLVMDGHKSHSTKKL